MRRQIVLAITAVALFAGAVPGRLVRSTGTDAATPTQGPNAIVAATATAAIGPTSSSAS